jgi:hypothetical protein
MMVKLEGGQMAAFKKRLKLATDVFLSQFVVAEEAELQQES